MEREREGWAGPTVRSGPSLSSGTVIDGAQKRLLAIPAVRAWARVCQSRRRLGIASCDGVEA